MLPRERIDALLDEGSPFLELSPLAGRDVYGAWATHPSHPPPSPRTQDKVASAHAPPPREHTPAPAPAPPLLQTTKMCLLPGL